MPHGKLTVALESASDIKDITSNGDGSYPFYHTEFEFEIDRSTEELAISVYSRDSAKGKDELVGYTTLDFKTVFFHGHTVPLAAYALTRSSGKPGGTINISLTFKARPSPYANPHAPVRQQSAPEYHPRNHDFDDGGYGSSGSDNSRGSAGGQRPSHVRRSHSQPAEHHYDQQDQCYTPAAAPARRPIPGGPTVVPNQARPVYLQVPQQPVRAVGLPHQPVYNRMPGQPCPVQPMAQQQQVMRPQQQFMRPQQQQQFMRPQQQQQFMRPQQQQQFMRPQQQQQVMRPRQQQQVMRPQQQRPQQQLQQQRPQQQLQQQQQGPSVAAQVGTAVAVGAAKATIQGLFGLFASE